MVSGIVEFIQGKEHEQLFSIMKKANRELLLASAIIKDFYIIDSLGNKFRLSKILTKLALKKVDIKVLTTPKMKDRLFYSNIEESGNLVDIRFCPRLHVKMVIIDAKIAYFGSANLTGAGLGMKGEHKRNFEIGAITKDPSIVRSMHELFYSIWYGKMCRKCKFFKFSCNGI